MSRIPDDSAAQDAPEAIWRSCAPSSEPDAPHATARTSGNTVIFGGRHCGKAAAIRTTVAAAEVLGLQVIDGRKFVGNRSLQNLRIVDELTCARARYGDADRIYAFLKRRP